MRVVAAPHDAVDADLAHRVGVARRGERGADVHVAAEVVARLVREHDRRVDAELADASVALHLGVELVHAVENFGDPARSLLGEHDVRPGKRSKTPDIVRCHSARLAQNPASITNITTEHGTFGNLGMPVPPAWCVTGMPRSWQTCQIGSYFGENSGSIHGVSGDTPGRSTPRRPCS